jgi:WD40 repeat protein/tetratricopeptide (TPR) repeat protein
MAIYDAFISYSHAKDKPIAAALQQAVQKLGKPWYRRRALRVFRDDTSLSATPHLWPTIEQALGESRYFILLASPEAAASKWVNKEVEHWLAHNSVDTLLIGLTDGALTWDETTGDFAAADNIPLPPVVKRRFPAEPKWIDLTAYRAGATARDSKFTELAADFAAAIRGMPKEDLLSEEVRQQRRALRLAYAVAVLLLAFLGAAVTAAKFAIDNARIAREQEQIAQQQRVAAETSEREAIAQRQEADHQRDLALKNEKLAQANEERARQQRDAALMAQSRFLADQARQETGRGNATGAVLLALDGLPDKTGPDEVSRTRPYAIETERALYAGLIARKELTVLQGTAIVSAAFSASGRQVLTAGRDGTAGLWDVHSGRELALLKAHAKRLNGASFSADERRILTWSFEERSARSWDARSWDARTASPLATIALPDKLRLVALTPDGTRVVTAGLTTAQVFDAQTGRELCVLRGHKEIEETRFGPSETPGTLGPRVKQINPESIMGGALTRDGTRLLTVARDKTARVWDLDACQQVLVFEGHKADIFLGRISADGRRAATTSRAPPGPGEIGVTSERLSEVRVWDLATGKQAAVVTTEAFAFPDIALSPDGSHLVTAGYGIDLWDVATAQRIATVPSRSGDKVQYSRDGSRLLVTSDDGSIRLLDAKTLKQTGAYGSHGGGVMSAAFSPDQTRILSVGGEGSARIWSIEQPADGVRTLTADLPEHEVKPTRFDSGPRIRRPGTLLEVAFSPDSKLIAASGTDGSVRVWSTVTGRLFGVLPDNGQNAWLNFSPDGRRLAVSGGERYAKIWEVATGREALWLEARSRIARLAFRRDGALIAAALDDHSVTVWSASRGARLADFAGHKDGIYSISWSPNGEEILTSSFDGTLRIWNQGGERAVLKGHDGYVYEAAFTADGKYVVSRGADRSIAIWDAASGKLLNAVKHRSTILPDRFELATAFALSDDARYVAMLFASDIVIWSLEEMKEVALLKAPLPMGFRAVAFGADSTRIIAHIGSINEAAVQFWDWKRGQFVSSVAAPHVLSGLTGLRPSPDRTLLAFVGNAEASIQLLPIFSSTQALVDHAKTTLPRCLTANDQEQSFARGTLAQWCEEHAIWPATPGRLGIRMRRLADDELAALGLPETSGGVAITTVQVASAAEAAGLKPGDVILAINGQPVRDPAEAAGLIGRAAAGAEMVLNVLRKGEKTDISARLRETLFTPDQQRGEAMALIAPALPEQPTPAQIAAGLDAAERARDMLDDLAADIPEDAQLLHDLALVYDRLAALQRRAARADAVVTAQRKALALRQKLAEATPGDPQRQRELAANNERLGATLDALQRRDEALAAYRAALEIRQRLAAEEPGNAERSEDVAYVLEEIGDLLRAGGRPAEAMASFEEALAIRAALAGADGTAQRQRLLIALHNKIGEVLAAEKRADEALNHYRQALALRAALADAEPGNPQLRWNLSASHLAIGEVLAGEKEYDEAMASYRQCLEIRAPLVASQSGNLTWQRGLATVYGKLGDTHKAQKKLDEAIQTYQQALTIRERVANAEPSEPAWRRELSLAFDDLADAFEDDGKLDAALDALRKSLALARYLAARDPNNQTWQRDVAVTLRNIGRVLTTQKKLPGALAAYRENLAISERLIDRYGSTAEWQADRRRAISGIGGLAWYLVLASDFKTALAASDEMIKRAPDQVWLHTNRAHALMFLDRTEEARMVYLAHRGTPKVSGDKTWEATVLDDFAALRKAGLTRPLLDEIEKTFAAGG